MLLAAALAGPLAPSPTTNLVWGPAPVDLIALVRTRYPSHTPPQLADLPALHQKLFLADQRGTSPGVVALDIDGDGRPEFGLLLHREDPPGGALVLARSNADTWDLHQLLRWNAPSSAVIFAKEQSRREYWSYERHDFLVFDGDVLLVMGYEAWSRDYGLVDGELRWVPLTD